MNPLLNYIPTIEPDELMFIQGLSKDLNEPQLQQFATIYGARRKEPQTILFTAAVGFLGIAGIHRFLTNSTGLGVLYLFTAGLCFIGTLVDLINHKRIAFEYNSVVAQQVYHMVKSA